MNPGNGGSTGGDETGLVVTGDVATLSGRVTGLVRE
jgi:hypothetical protein